MKEILTFTAVIFLALVAIGIYVFLAVANWFISSWLADDVLKTSGFLDVALKVVFFFIIGSIIHGTYRFTKSSD